jgi:hypothetical protein
MIFISYSRRDYYFAESLAFQLMQRGLRPWLDAKDLAPGADWAAQVDTALQAARCLILVVSSTSLDSKNVRDEWRRAKEQGTRIIAVLFRKRRLPPELHGVEVVDFRGSFTPALEELSARLASAPTGEPRHRSHRPWSPRLLPPWVTGITGVFAFFLASVAGPFLVQNYWSAYLSMVHSIIVSSQTNPLRNPTYITAPVSVLAFAAFIKFTLLDFVFRRMGMTRLALTFLYLVATAGLVLGASLLGGEAVAPPVQFVRQILHDAWPVHLLLLLSGFGGAVAGLVIVVYTRPDDLLRWAPTGTAWWKYRARYAPPVTGDPLHALAVFTRVEQYILEYDVRDTPAAARVRQVLQAAGATETTTRSADILKVFLVTNYTDPVQIEQHLQSSQERILTMVGTSIPVRKESEAFQWLGRFQSVDFRRWDARLAAQEGALPLVPEAFTRLRLPRRVASTHHLLCLVSALLLTVSFPADGSSGYAPFIEKLGALVAWFRLPWPGVSVVIFLAGTFVLLLGLPWSWARLASTFLHRATTEQHWFRSLGIVSLVSLVSLVTVLVSGWHHRDTWVTQQLCVAALVFLVVIAAMVHQRKACAFWFPVFDGRKTKRGTRIPAGKWRTVTWCGIYWLGWSIVWMFGGILGHLLIPP